MLPKWPSSLQVTRLVVIEVRSESFGLVTERRHDILVLCAVSHIFAYWTSLTFTHVIFFIADFYARDFYALCVYSKFEYHPHPYATFVPNFVSVAPSIATEKHSVLNHSPTQLT